MYCCILHIISRNIACISFRKLLYWLFLNVAFCSLCFVCFYTFSIQVSMLIKLLAGVILVLGSKLWVQAHGSDEVSEFLCAKIKLCKNACVWVCAYVISQDVILRVFVLTFHINQPLGMLKNIKQLKLDDCCWMVKIMCWKHRSQNHFQIRWQDKIQTDPTFG